MLESIRSDQVPAPIGPYSPGMKIGDWLFVSGQIPMEPSTGRMVEGDMAAQARRVFKNIEAVVVAAGGTLQQVVKLTVYTVDLSEFAVFNQVMQEFFSPPYPARAVVQVAGLPAKARLEIDAVVFLGGN